MNPIDRRTLECLTVSVLANGLNEASVVLACGHILGPFPHFAKRLAARLARRFPSSVRPSQRRVEHFLARDWPLRRLLQRLAGRALDWRPVGPPRMLPAPGRAQTWNVPAIVTEGDLAHWLNLDIPSLLWLSDLRNGERKAAAEPLRNYRRRWIPKPNGSRLPSSG